MGRIQFRPPVTPQTRPQSPSGLNATQSLTAAKKTETAGAFAAAGKTPPMQFASAVPPTQTPQGLNGVGSSTQARGPQSQGVNPFQSAPTTFGAAGKSTEVGATGANQPFTPNYTQGNGPFASANNTGNAYDSVKRPQMGGQFMAHA